MMVSSRLQCAGEVVIPVRPGPGGARGSLAPFGLAPDRKCPALRRSALDQGDDARVGKLNAPPVGTPSTRRKGPFTTAMPISLRRFDIN